VVLPRQDRVSADLYRGGVQWDVSAMHEAEGRRDAPQTLLATDRVVVAGNLDPAGLRVDAVSP
jgi:hypothetical protein